MADTPHIDSAKERMGLEMPPLQHDLGGTDAAYQLFQMSRSTDRSSALADLGTVLLNANGLVRTYKCLLKGVQRLGFSRVRLYFCYRNPDTTMLELVGAGHWGPSEEREHMLHLFEQGHHVIDPQCANYKASIACIVSRRPVVFSVGIEYPPQQRLPCIDYLELPEDPMADVLLKRDSVSGKTVSTWCELPLIIDDVAYGKFSVDKKNREDLSFSESDLKALCSLRGFAEAAIGRAEAYERDRVIAAAEESAGQAVADNHNTLQAACRSILDETAKLCRADGGHVRLYSLDLHTLVKVAACQNGADLWPVERPVGSAVSGQVFVAQKPMVFNDAEKSESVQELRGHLGSASNEMMEFFRGEQAFACFPLMWGHACRGTLTLTSKTKHVFAGRQNLIERIAKATAARIDGWRSIQERTSAEQRSRLGRTVLQLLDDMTPSPDDRIRTMLVALTSGHGFRYNSCLLFCRSSDGDVVTCRGAIGSESRAEAEHGWNSQPRSEYGGSLHDDVAVYLSQSEKIESRGFPARCLGRSFRLSEATGTLANVFAHNVTDPVAVAVRDWVPMGDCGPPRGIEAESVLIVPVSFSDQAVAALYLDNAWLTNTPWTDKNHLEDLKRFCKEVIAPTLIMDHDAPLALERCARRTVLETTPGIFLSDNSGVLRQSDILFRHVMGGDSRGQSLLDVASVRGTRIENDVRQALQGKEVVQTEVRFKSIFGANTELDYHAFPIRFGGRQVGAIGLIWDSKLTRLNAKEKLTDIVLAQTHSLVRLVRELREALPSPGVASDSRQESADLTTARKLADNLASAVEGLRSASRVAYGLRRTPIDVRNGLRSVLEQLNTGVSIDVRINAPPSLPRAACDPLLFHLIFENLARNALDAMRNVEHPVLRFDLRYPAPTLGEDGLEIMLLDNGPGLPEPVLCALRQGLGSADLARHAGLGLAIVRTLLEIAGGSIAVCDEPQKCGAGLGIELPVARNGRDR